MIFSLLSGLRQFWYYYVIAALLLYTVVLNNHINSYKLDLVNAKQQIVARETLLNQQNAAILAWKQQADVEAKKQKKAIAEAEKWRENYLAENEKLNNVQLSDNCEEVMSWMIEQARS